jgi:regulator of RNase E activity RraA
MEKLKLVSVSFVVRDEADADAIAHELNDLNFGIYSMGTTTRGLTKKELREVKSMVPKDVLCG